MSLKQTLKQNLALGMRKEKKKITKNRNRISLHLNITEVSGMQLRKEKLLIVHRRCCWLNREKKTDKTIVEMDEEVIRRIMDQYNEHLSYLHFYIPRLNMPLLKYF